MDQGFIHRIEPAAVGVAELVDVGIECAGVDGLPDNERADVVEAAAASGITAIVQPGGSIRDDESIKVADKHNIAMVFTGIRHFRH